MKVNEFLASYDKDKEIKINIYDSFTHKNRSFQRKDDADYKFGYCSVRRWSIENGELHIVIASQF